MIGLWGLDVEEEASSPHSRLSYIHHLLLCFDPLPRLSLYHRLSS
jgi:hypothetical protein